MIKRFLKGCIVCTANHEPFWTFYLGCRWISKLLINIYYEATKHRVKIDPDVERLVKTYFPELIVQHGLFQGMRYFNAQACGSVLLPKLLGSYEAELHPALEFLLTRRCYTEIVDIGCAEGYYAVGMGRLFPEAKIYAYDISERARIACMKMAEINGVAGRLLMNGWCDSQILASLPIRQKALIMADCEGYEGQLFSPEVGRRLSAHDVLVEVHDGLDACIARRLRAAFAETHEILVVRSIDDAMKTRTYSYPEFEQCSLSDRFRMLAEHRGIIMEWFLMTPKGESIPEAEATVSAKTTIGA